MRRLVQRYLAPALRLWNRRRLQALLSTLGITAGVSGLILVAAIGEGASRELRASLGALGAGTLMVRNNAAQSGDNALTLQRVRAIERLGGPALQQLLPLRKGSWDVVANQTRVSAVRVTGATRGYRDLLQRDLHGGRFLADHDVRWGSRVCVLGWEAGKTLFPRGQVIGQQVRIGQHWFKVVGWLGDSTQRLPQLESLDLEELGQTIFVPYSASLFGDRGQALDELVLRFGDEASMMAGLAMVKRALALAAREPALEYIIPIELLRHKQRVQQLFQYFLLGIAAVLLLVGGVGMMNIMLFNVISRRPEIGLRRAIGATRRDIIAQFVTESMVIALAGGAIGILLGLVGALLLDVYSDWQLAFSGNAALLGFCASLLIGALFGSYPALQAASVSPVQSLRD